MGKPPATLYLNRLVSLGEALTADRHNAGMKRLLAALALSTLITAPAVADTLANQVKSEAERLLPQVRAAQVAAAAKPGVKPPALTPTLSKDLQRFGLAAGRLSIEVNNGGGPADLRCIFRGMSEETGRQLTAALSASTGADQAKALGRLTHVLADAAEIAPAVGVTPDDTKAKSAIYPTCPAVRTN